ncbi:DUF938 domain-containing protein [Hyphobacterium sp. HN65]|uniref:DUF938 domain-containing protein n=1 Tax=Hyphobacterium lacteum TaxID=3116575 RepID=A0ABU7LT36_9PROT|nr:DUF938 domain-containing protein [Hyphobacterium sp. HN65]MEE2527063.1 DUF938 domain-containing protein [Hyphobacterium sp. HN65]
MAETPPAKTVALEDRKQSGGKLYAPSSARNAGPIRDILAPRLIEGARVVEIGCGTGEHAEAVCMARPDISWLPSDLDDAARASASARAREIAGLQDAVEIDASTDGWETGPGTADALVCCNVIHISPWVVAEGLAKGAETLVARGGLVFLYGPFLEGAATAPSNLAFDVSLKQRNPQWGVRSLDAVTGLFERHSFALEERIEMPSNNLSLVFRRPE